MIYLRNVLFYLIFYSGSLPCILASYLLHRIAPPASRKLCDIWSAYHRICCRVFLGIKMRETGTRPEGQAFYAIKHEAFYEAIAIPSTFKYPTGFAKEELFAIPAWGKAARAYGAIPVARKDGAKALRAMIREVRPAVAQGRPVVIFPEGTRIEHGKSAPLQSGFAALYKLLDLPVVPVAVNSGELYQPFWKRPGTITFHFGEAIAPGLPREEIERRVLEGINCLNGSPQ